MTGSRSRHVALAGPLLAAAPAHASFLPPEVMDAAADWLALFVLFVVPRVRTVAFVWGATMHLAIGILMYRVGYFAAQSIAFYPLFAPPGWIHAIRRRLHSGR